MIHMAGIPSPLRLTHTRFSSSGHRRTISPSLTNYLKQKWHCILGQSITLLGQDILLTLFHATAIKEHKEMEEPGKEAAQNPKPLLPWRTGSAEDFVWKRMSLLCYAAEILMLVFTQHDSAYFYWYNHPTYMFGRMFPDGPGVSPHGPPGVMRCLPSNKVMRKETDNEEFKQKGWSMWRLNKSETKGKNLSVSLHCLVKLGENSEAVSSQGPKKGVYVLFCA